MQNFPFNYEAIPERMRPGLLRFINDGREPGGFLCAVLEGDLHAACGRADSENLALIAVYSAWLYNKAPAGTWGSESLLKNWVAKGGLNGIKAKPLTDEAFVS